VFDGVEGREVATPVQSYTPSLTIRPAMLYGTFFEALHSVNARDVASVPPRCEPYKIIDRGEILELA
jgi:hypothetical protein